MSFQDPTAPTPGHGTLRDRLGGAEVHTNRPTLAPRRVAGAENPGAPPPPQAVPLSTAAAQVGATMIFRRGEGTQDRWSSYGIIVDGKKVGSIKRSSEVRITGTPGRHRVRLQAPFSWTSSPTIEVSMDEGASALFECGPNTDYFLMMFPPVALYYATFGWSKYIWLRLTPAPGVGSNNENQAAGAAHSAKASKKMVGVALSGTLFLLVALCLGLGALTPHGPGTVLFSDDFKNPDRGKLPKSSTNTNLSKIGYESGEYRIQTLDPNTEHWQIIDLPNDYQDVSVRITANAATENTYPAVACRNQADLKSGYGIRVSPTWRFAYLYRQDAGAVGEVTKLTPILVSNAIHRDGVPNLIELTCTGNTIAGSVNGTLVAWAQDSTYTKGTAGFGAGGVAADARFDDLLVVRADPKAPPLPLATPGVGATILSDTFKDPAVGFLAESSPDPAKWTRGYEDGHYRLRKIDPALPGAPNVDLVGSYDDTTLAVTVRVEDDAPSSIVGIECRDQADDQSGYRMTVAPNLRTVSLVRNDGPRTVDLIPSKVADSVRAGSEANRIELTCSGSTISAVVNGTSIGSVEDPTYRTGTQSLLAFYATLDDLVLTKAGSQ